MLEKRLHKRLDCVEKCILYHDHSKYSGSVMNISLSGALLNLPDSARNVLKAGDTCRFVLINNPEEYYCSYKGRIARVYPSGIGLEILEHEF